MHKGGDTVSKGCMKFFKGMLIGLAAGCAAGVIGCCYVKQHRRGFKKQMSRALRNMSELVDNVNGMF